MEGIKIFLGYHDLPDKTSAEDEINKKIAHWVEQMSHKAGFQIEKTDVRLFEHTFIVLVQYSSTE